MLHVRKEPGDMCYAKPGPRCSAHAKADLEAANSRGRSILTRLKDTETEIAEALKNNNSKLADELGKRLPGLYKEINANSKDVASAQYIYDSTPEGTKKLKAELATLEKKLSEKHTYDDAYKNDELTRRVQIAELLRTRQTALWKAQKEGNLHSRSVTINANTDSEVAASITATTLEGNTFTGRVRETLTTSETKHYQKLQERVDTLIGYFKTKNGELLIDEELVQTYNHLELTPGYKFVGAGANQAAYVDEQTQQVIKMPLDYVSPSSRRDGYGFDYYSEMIRQNDSEQYSYAVFDANFMDEEDVEYVTTMFFTSKTARGIQVQVQPYLVGEEYRAATPEESKILYRKVGKVEGLFDLHAGNFKINMKTGKFVLFDCLDPDPHLP